ncbi:5-formyltetrahydrofolate cyclo-ligase [Acinetobacter baylyi]|uniref:5-formyltetrahydrofolate cyclo-ligase n=1 Tax=Acinetobacter baylyi (strain ATCC 33305 / BD413 / ADP1) TaxID=62977 RepID=Q6FD61_ACIAD|nr:5-formyltetrahydrofolate cyclo-ligase [Acinetobacter baylyi]ENV55421.1 5-formyltetrahydrofolate cyclo-ligase [Acinetobacter baylyi DSM 14961 = CIP 107474]KAF2370475.1 5-formyltetrahydrofolate cyclo-ligase [Acinetobacter baylyi]KAF2373892.1 5-formyltetrahydrofolate cyclo-ligase [Acinetobacter baylyi]KAF2377765.1 5-formyltetrahydrofolate cyclo-ligase [Acinetobacter baylyi]KAF2382322.1 5-formyltetrahydrofolate cyclo-ligase [Acinetobacter baylyi]|tara:strand:- start:9 stop:644 length:636 start_codon:yes stop_codon:yes gene_type:complete
MNHALNPTTEQPLSSLEIKALRKKIIRQRRFINRYLQLQSEQKCLYQFRQFLKNTRLTSSQNIGLYLHAFGEIYTRKIILECFKLGKKVYLPMICNVNQTLVWIEITKTQYFNRRFYHHALGMKEPMASRGHHVSHLDLLLMPLVACDDQGTRMGMGGGFYDRTLVTSSHTPFRLGLAHSFQYLDQKLFRQSWDQPLDALLTPEKCYRFKR